MMDHYKLQIQFIILFYFYSWWVNLKFNAMCVFPVLSIKFMSFLNNPSDNIRLSFIYSYWNNILFCNFGFIFFIITTIWNFNFVGYAVPRALLFIYNFICINHFFTKHLRFI